MSNDTHETASTQFVQVGDVRFAYGASVGPASFPCCF